MSPAPTVPLAMSAMRLREAIMVQRTHRLHMAPGIMRRRKAIGVHPITNAHIIRIERCPWSC